AARGPARPRRVRRAARGDVEADSAVDLDAVVADGVPDAV
ncbi:MAG: hypothetical protein AVDCRST_MAG59-805, partial [uncultured Thermomicrobiales bacterium]